MGKEMEQQIHQMYQNLLRQSRADIVPLITNPYELVDALYRQEVILSDDFNFLKDHRLAQLREEAADVLLESDLELLERITTASEKSKHDSLANYFVDLIGIKVPFQLNFNSNEGGRSSKKLCIKVKPKIRYIRGERLSNDSGTTETVSIEIEIPEGATLWSAVRSQNVEEVRKLLATLACFDQLWETARGTVDPILITAINSGNTCKAVEIVKMLIAKVKPYIAPSQSADPKKSLQSFLELQNRRQYTALQLAAERGAIAIAKELIFSFTNLTLKNFEDKTILDTMHEHAPELIRHYNSTFALESAQDYQDRDITFNVDFQTVVGQQINYGPGQAKPPESTLLAQVVFRSKSLDGSNGPSLIFSDPILKIFTHLKWDKMFWWMMLSMITYSILYILYTFFLIHIFVLVSPYDKTCSVPPQTASSMWVYIVDDFNCTDVSVDVEPSIGVIGGISFVVSILMVIVEVCELFAISKLTSDQVSLHPGDYWHLLGIVFGFLLLGSTLTSFVHVTILFFSMLLTPFALFGVYWMTSKCAISTSLSLGNFVNGMNVYLANFENVLQCILYSLAIHVSAGISVGHIHRTHYASAVTSVVLTWTCILLQLGNLMKFGPSVQLLKLVIKRFLYPLVMFMPLLMAFCIAFSILFPDLFPTLPRSFTRIFSMMLGELDQKDVFTESRLLFPREGMTLHSLFVISVPICLMSVLMATSIEAVEEVKAKSQVKYNAILVERLYIMESFLSLVSAVLCCPLDTHVVVRTTADTPNIATSGDLRIGIFPVTLQEQIRAIMKNQARM